MMTGHELKRTRVLEMLTLGVAAMVAVLGAGGEARAGNGFCSDTARTLFAACKQEVANESSVHKAVCINITDAAMRTACLDERKAEQSDSRDFCAEQRDTRLDNCKSVGEGRYDPDFSPALFDDPKNPSNPNPYFPLTVGNHWEYHSTPSGEVDVVDIVDETKLIAGVTCIVARDVVSKNGLGQENTDDWYASAKSGATWYFGEEEKDFEIFPGDDPQRPELVGVSGSFKAGRDGAKPGIIFLASPHVGDIYFEEFALAEAEDVTEVLSTSYKFGENMDLDQNVPQALAVSLCSDGDCVVTKNFSLLEPGDVARKYYAKGIGVFLEVELGGDVVQLVDCNVDMKCPHL